MRRTDYPGPHSEAGTAAPTPPAGQALTGAELRLLPLLSTNLSFPEIGKEFFLSSNTIKTQAMSIYQKLGASSRSQAAAMPHQARHTCDPGQHSGAGTPAGMLSAGQALTGAELRLLPMLSTNLSFPEIGREFLLSRHTIKSQAMSIYRKLGATSRSEAVTASRELGLLAG
jgi:DNA-binding CsgD family transcriptional regulator